MNTTSFTTNNPTEIQLPQPHYTRGNITGYSHPNTEEYHLTFPYGKPTFKPQFHQHHCISPSPYPCSKYSLTAFIPNLFSSSGNHTSWSCTPKKATLFLTSIACVQVSGPLSILSLGLLFSFTFLV